MDRNLAMIASVIESPPRSVNSRTIFRDRVLDNTLDSKESYDTAEKTSSLAEVLEKRPYKGWNVALTHRYGVFKYEVAFATLEFEQMVAYIEAIIVASGSDRKALQ